MQHHRPFRALHLIDIENLLADPRPNIQKVRQARTTYESQVEVGDHDLVVVACNHGCALEVGLAYTGARLKLRSGPDGADLALLDVLGEHDVGTRFDAVFIASGDGIFTAAVASLAGLGVTTVVVARSEALAVSLRLAAGGRVVAFAATGTPTEPTAANSASRAA